MKLYKIICTQALKIYICIVLYFFAMKIIGADDIVQLRLLNFVFVFWGVNGAIKKNLHENKDTTYLINLLFYLQLFLWFFILLFYMLILFML